MIPNAIGHDLHKSWTVKAQAETQEVSSTKRLRTDACASTAVPRDWFPADPPTEGMFKIRRLNCNENLMSALTVGHS